MERTILIRRIRACLAVFMGGLVLSGLTAFPLGTELSVLSRIGISDWLQTVRRALIVTNQRYPFLAYGTDWLGFAHLVIAVVFVGPWRDPVRNKWVLTFGLMVCAAVVPMALIAGAIRGIPFWWRMVDCTFGVGGAIPLATCRYYVTYLEGARKHGDRHPFPP
jgi:hypothetical protein